MLSHKQTIPGYSRAFGRARVFHNESGADVLDRPGRREATNRQRYAARSNRRRIRHCLKPRFSTSFCSAIAQRGQINPIAVSLLRKRLLWLDCACAESRCNGGVSGAVSNKGM